MHLLNSVSFKGFYGTITTSDGTKENINIKRKATILEVSSKNGLLTLKERTNGSKLDDAFEASNVKALNLTKVDNYSELELKENAGKEGNIKIDAVGKNGIVHQEKGSQSIIGKLENHTKLYLGLKSRADITFTDTFTYIYQDEQSVSHIKQLNGNLELGEKTENMGLIPDFEMEKEFLPDFIIHNHIKERIRKARNNNGNGDHNGNGHFRNAKYFDDDSGKTISIIENTGFVSIISQGANTAVKIKNNHDGTLAMYVNAVTSIGKSKGTITLQENCNLHIEASSSYIQASGKSKTYIDKHLKGDIDLYGHNAGLYIAGNTIEANDDDHHNENCYGHGIHAEDDGHHHAEHDRHIENGEKEDHHGETRAGHITRHHHDPTHKQKAHSCGHVGHAH